MPKPPDPTEKPKRDFPGKRIDASGNVRYRIEVNFELPDREAIHKGAEEEGCREAEYLWRMAKLGMEAAALQKRTHEDLEKILAQHLESHSTIVEIHRFLDITTHRFNRVYDRIIENQNQFL